MKSQLMLAAMIGVCPGILRAFPDPKPAKLFTHADEQRLAKAQAKRNRKAAKRAKKEAA